MPMTVKVGLAKKIGQPISAHWGQVVILNSNSMVTCCFRIWKTCSGKSRPAMWPADRLLTMSLLVSAELWNRSARRPWWARTAMVNQH